MTFLKKCAIIDNRKLDTQQAFAEKSVRAFFMSERSYSMLAKKVIRNGTDIDNRIIEQITMHRLWKELYDTVSYSPALHNIVEDILENKETELTELIRMKDSLEDIIMANNNCDQREILRLRYFENLSWADVAEQLDTDDIDWVKKQHRKALKKIHVECTCCCDYEDNCYADEE